MADARMPERMLLDRRINRLSDKTFRAYVTAMIWSVSNRTDGEVTRDDLRTVPYCSSAIATKLVDAELWEETPDGWLILEYASTQTSRDEFEQLETIRRREREKKRRQRSRRSEDGAGDVSGDASPGTAQARPRLGEALKEEVSIDSESETLGDPPSKFCDDHQPDGSGGISCGPCGDARFMYQKRMKEWEAAKSKLERDRRLRPPTSCPEHIGYPIPCDRCAREVTDTIHVEIPTAIGGAE